MKLTSYFITNYYDLPWYRKKDKGFGIPGINEFLFFKGGYIKEWNLPKNDIGSYVNKGSSGIDFLWQAMIFNLFVKIVYNYYEKNFKYCGDFIAWRFNVETRIPIFKGKFKNFIDDKFLPLSNKTNKNVRDHSLINMNAYCAFLFSIFDLMNNNCCEFNSREVILKIIDNKEFKEEFSDDPKSMSYIFRKTLLNYR